VVLSTVLQVAGLLPWVLTDLQIDFPLYFKPQAEGDFLHLNRGVRRAAVIGRVRQLFFEAYKNNPRTALYKCCDSVCTYTHELLVEEKFTKFSGKPRDARENLCNTTLFWQNF
jgi:hypothetical protein